MSAPSRETGRGAICPRRSSAHDKREAWELEGAADLFGAWLARWRRPQRRLPPHAERQPPPTSGRPTRSDLSHVRANASVDLGEKDRDAAGGEIRKVVYGGLTLVGAKARLQRVHVLERELGDALVRNRAPVRRRDTPRGLKSLEAGNRGDQRARAQGGPR